MRTVALIARSGSKYLDPFTGKELQCIGTDINQIVDMYNTIRDAKGVIQVGRGKGTQEVKLDEVRILANHTAGGEIKPTLRYHD